MFGKKLLLLASLLATILINAHPDQISVLVRNKAITPNNNIKTITFVSVPFSGHSNILIQSALELAQNPDLAINFIITGWQNIRLAPQKIAALKKAKIAVYEINDTPLATPAPMAFTFPRVQNLVDDTIAACKKSDLIIYDFFAIEGFLAGKHLSIATICSIPAIVGPFNPENSDFKQALAANMPIIKMLEKKFNLSILDHIEMVSDAFLIPSDDENIVWSWPELIQSSPYTKNRSLKNITFARPAQKMEVNSIPIDLAGDKKLIYVSFGTVVTQNLWNNIPQVKKFVSAIFAEIIRELGDNDQYEVIISTGRKPSDIIQSPPSNVHLFEHVDQKAVLARADLFITHGGGNSINEAIDHKVPMIVIPFFGDQHLCASNVHMLNIGHAFMHTLTDRQKAISTQANLFERGSLNPIRRLGQTIKTVLADPEYKHAFKKVKSATPATLPTILSQRFLFHWKEGDLLYGSSTDRKAFAQKLGLSDYYRIGDTRPFCSLFADIDNAHALPKLIDQYNDALRGPDFATERLTKKFTTYAQNLEGFHTFLDNNSHYLLPLGHYPATLDNQASLETVWNMCLGGLDFFLSKGSTIHFVIKDYKPHNNPAPAKEIEWIKDHWHEPRVRNNLKFYRMDDAGIKMVDPEIHHWFNKISQSLQRKNIVLIGPPGSGKSTLSKQAASVHDYVRISVGDFFRQEIAQHTSFGKQIESIIKQGKYVDEETVYGVIKSHIAKAIQQEKPFVIDGFPHSLESFQFLHQLLQEFHLSSNTCFIQLLASDELCTQLLLKRIVCKACQTTTSSNITESCVQCGKPLEKRISDTAQTIQKRLLFFHEHIEPSIKTIKQLYPFFTLNATGIKPQLLLQSIRVE